MLSTDEGGLFHESRFNARSDAERREMGAFGEFVLPVFPGDLDFVDRAWFTTHTVNRSIYAYDPHFEVELGPRMGTSLDLLVADYLPTLESRGWLPPYAYDDSGNWFIEKISGYLLVPESGEYRLWLETNRSAALFLQFAPESAMELFALTMGGKDSEVATINSVPTDLLPLRSDEPVYFELWRIETAGPDSLRVGWSIGAPSAQSEAIPAIALSSTASGIPGSYPRSLPFSDPHLFTAPTDLPPLLDVLTENLGVSGHHLTSHQVINSGDFNPPNEWLLHALQGNGLGWL